MDTQRHMNGNIDISGRKVIGCIILSKDVWKLNSVVRGPFCFCEFRNLECFSAPEGEEESEQWQDAEKRKGQDHLDDAGEVEDFSDIAAVPCESD